MAVIYQITNMVNGKYYIGSAESFARREWQHKYELKKGTHKNPRLQAAWNKYGPEAFVFEVLEDIAEGRDAFDVENTYLFQHVGRRECYNVNTDAIGMRTGIPHTQAAKDKTSASRKGKAAGPDHYRYGKEVAPEVRAKIGAAQKGKPKAAGRKVTEEGRAKIRANIEAGRSHKHWLGKHHTEEAKAKLSKPVQVTDSKGNTETFDSITALREELKLTPPTVNRALKSGQPISRGPLKGWVFKYVAAV